MEPTQEKTIAAVKKNFADIRHNLENDRYKQVDSLLQEQRDLLQQLPQDDPSSLDMVVEAQELLRWSLSLVALQRHTYMQSLSTILHLKQLDGGYTPSAICSSDFVSLAG